MTEVSLETYTELLSRSGLLGKDVIEARLQEFTEHASSGETDATVEEHPEQTAQSFARYLRDADLVTEWQNKNLLRGRFRGLMFGKFRVLRLLGAGGMGRVFLAEDSMLARRVALKVLPKQRTKGGTSLQRFHREARALAKLNHGNIVRVHDVDTREDTHYIVMEFIKGADLSSLVRKRGPLSEADAVEYTRQTAIGLQHAHANGLIHRDIKPANLLLDTTGTIKILDLGLALLQNDDDASITADPTRTLGTVDYVSPEQALNSHEIDHRTDLYSLGCTLHYLLTGSAPFGVGTNAQRLMAHQTQTPPDINSARAVAGLSSVSPWLTQLCRKLMAKSPNDRYASAAELADQIGKGHSTGNETLTTPRIEITSSPSRSKVGATKVNVTNGPESRSGDQGDARSSSIRARRSRSRRSGTLLWSTACLLSIAIVSIPIIQSFNGPADREQLENASRERASEARASNKQNLNASQQDDFASDEPLVSGSETQAGRFYVVGDNKTYHRHDCSILRSKHNLHEVTSSELDGLRACGRCKP